MTPNSYERDLGPKHCGEMVERMRVSVESLQPHPMQMEVYGAVDLDETFIGSIRDQGLIQPPVVTIVDGEHVIISGHRRIEALRALGAEYVDVLFRQYNSEEEMTLDFLASNKHRNKTSAVMIRETLKLLTAKPVPTGLSTSDIDDIADSQKFCEGLSTSAVAQRVGMTNDFVRAVRVVFADSFREQYFDDIQKSGVKLSKSARKAFERQWDAVREQVVNDEINLYEAASAIRNERAKVVGTTKVKNPKPVKGKVVVLDDDVNHHDNAMQFLREMYGERFDEGPTKVMDVTWDLIAELMVDYANHVNA